MQTQKLIEVKDIKKQYKGAAGKTIHALRGVSLDINAGEVIGLLGANGAGKTTLASIIVTLHPATSGDIFYDGKSVYKNLYDYRRMIGFCPQKPNLYPGLTIEQNLMFAGRFYGLEEDVIKTRVQKLVKRYSLQQYLDQYPSSLSGGYKQRVMIARSLVHNPKLLLLDEPTVGLDPHIRRQLWTEIKNLRVEGVSIVLTTHYIEEADELSDRICVLDNGKITFLDTPENLKKTHKKGTLEEVFLKLVSEEAEAQ
ncbi:ABC transporter ATP-binding protein [Candidatus Babeliales bacterium]|nr:ABC transporter ATP-binding protein [Candidatus Babeliales bacterium]